MDTGGRLERAFGRSRVQMATGSHVEVYREAAQLGERRRYTKRFLATAQGDFREWTEREWRILARLFGHGVDGVAEVVQFDRGQPEGAGFVQTYDAGITVDHWLTLVPVSRDGRLLAHVFEDCAHWWALAHHCLRVLADIHRLQLVHLDLKADNVCIPADAPDFDPRIAGDCVRPDFERLALIDFAFSLVSGEVLRRPLPIGTGSKYCYQSPRLVEALALGRGGELRATQALDWRCDLFSLAAMLERCLPHASQVHANGWHAGRRRAAREFIGALRACHDAPVADPACHRRLLARSATLLSEPELKDSLARGWQPAGLLLLGLESDTQPTPLTRVAPLIEPPAMQADSSLPEPVARTATATVPHPRRGRRTSRVSIALALAALAGIGGWYWSARDDRPRIETAELDRPPATEPQERRHEPRAPDPAVVAEDPAPAPTPSIAAQEAQAPLDEEEAAMRPNVWLGLGRPAKETDELREQATARERETIANVPSASSSKAPISPPLEPRPEPRPEPAIPRRTGPPAAPSLGHAIPRRIEPPAAPSLEPATPRRTEAPVAPSLGHAAARPTEPRAEPQPQPAAPGPSEPRTAATEPEAPWLDPRAAEAVQQLVPHSVRTVEPRVADVLTIAGDSNSPAQDRAVRDAAARTIPSVGAPADWRVDSQTARRLHASAARAYWGKDDAARALRLQLRAFAADPLDPEIAGNLAFYQLRAKPSDPRRARQFALHALAVRTQAFPYGRIEDWTSLAVTNALLGHSWDAERAFYVVLALSPSLERSCRVALGSFATHGEWLEGPARALLARVHARGRSHESPLCAWPPDWSAGRRAP